MDARMINETTGQTRSVKVWDGFVRVFHWSVAVAFFIAYFSGEEALTLHVWAGYVIGGLVVLRVAWGFVGPRHARFSDFIYSPAAVVSYLRDLTGLRGRRYLGHSPAGGAMVLALLILLSGTVWSGLELYAAEENAGPLSATSDTTRSGGHVLTAALVSRAEASEHEAEDDGEEGETGEGGIWEEWHEGFANVALAFVILHIAGVLLASFAHHENLARSMITGYKRED